MSDHDDDEAKSGLGARFGIGGESGTWKSWMIAAAVVSIAVFTAVIWYAYKSGEEAFGPPPVVTADQSPVKVRPKEPGGAQVADQDKLVLNGEEGTETVAEDKLLPGTEQPIARAPASEETPPLPATDKTAASVGGAPEQTPEQTPEQASESGLSAVDGDFLIQLGAFRNRERATQAWENVRDKFPDVVTGLKADIAEAELGARGTFYRLRAGPLFDRAEADKLCVALKARGQGCIVAKP